jgi:hypothetical protein
MSGFFANFAEVLAHFAVKRFDLASNQAKIKVRQGGRKNAKRLPKSGHSPALLPLDNLSLLELNSISE